VSFPRKNIITSAGVRTEVGLPARAGGSVANGIGTSLPASPVSGQEFTLVDSVASPTYRWSFMYNGSSASAYKWEFIGGSDLVAVVNTSEGTATNSPTDLATVGPSITVPRAGDYNVLFGCTATNNTGNNAVCRITPSSGSVIGGPLEPFTNVNGRKSTLAGADQVQGISASGTIKIQYYAGAGTATFSERWIIVTPLRVS
jgi:hypothetical protein